jgi:2-octaprenyl-6-methoxyphenol hydroxylase
VTEPTAGTDCDIAIIGGGMVGATLACALAPLPLRVVMIESAEPELGAPPTYDDRAIALSYGTRRILDAIGVWPHLAAEATPIERIHVSDRGHFGFAHLDSREEGVPALGYVALARELGEALYRTLDRTDVGRMAPARFENAEQDHDGVTVELATADGRVRLRSRMLLAADGTRSTVRDALGIATRRHGYGQSAVITNVTPAKAHAGQAYERFTESGPVALLPMTENRCGVVWTWREEAVQEPLAWDDHTFISHLQEAFGYRLGRFLRVGTRRSYPLQLVMAKEAVRGRIALIGNAMHTVHPIAGQGFNLGIRDVAALAEVVQTGLRENGLADTGEVLRRYARWRRRDQESLAMITDGLVRLFGNPLGPVRVGRNLGLVLADIVPGVRHAIARHAMGLTGRLPGLARGIGLD